MEFRVLGRNGDGSARCPNGNPLSQKNATWSSTPFLERPVFRGKSFESPVSRKKSAPVPVASLSRQKLVRACVLLQGSKQQSLVLDALVVEAEIGGVRRTSQPHSQRPQQPQCVHRRRGSRIWWLSVCGDAVAGASGVPGSCLHAGRRKSPHRGELHILGWTFARGHLGDS